ncbi:hypothetical protein MHYP_G00260040 [Metynnis hypsauchen]
MRRPPKTNRIWAKSLCRVSRVRECARSDVSFRRTISKGRRAAAAPNIWSDNQWETGTNEGVSLRKDQWRVRGEPHQGPGELQAAECLADCSTKFGSLPAQK